MNTTKPAGGDGCSTSLLDGAHLKVSVTSNIEATPKKIKLKIN